MSPPPKPIQVRRDTVVNPDGSRVTTVNIDVRATVSALRQINGPQYMTDTRFDTSLQATGIEKSIERIFTRSYAVNERNITHYVTTVHTVTQQTAPDRVSFNYVDNRASVLGSGRFAGMAVPTTNSVYLSPRSGPTTAAHEFGHLAGLFHTPTTAGNPGASNLMDQAPGSTGTYLDRSQLDTIANNPAFR